MRIPSLLIDDFKSYTITPFHFSQMHNHFKAKMDAYYDSPSITMGYFFVFYARGYKTFRDGKRSKFSLCAWRINISFRIMIGLKKKLTKLYYCNSSTWGRSCWWGCCRGRGAAISWRADICQACWCCGAFDSGFSDGSWLKSFHAIYCPSIANKFVGPVSWKSRSMFQNLVNFVLCIFMGSQFSFFFRSLKPNKAKSWPQFNFKFWATQNKTSFCQL